MIKIEKLENGKYIIGYLLIDNIQYYLDEEKNVYLKIEDNYCLQKDKKIIDKVKKYLNFSSDVIF